LSLVSPLVWSHVSLLMRLHVPLVIRHELAFNSPKLLVTASKKPLSSMSLATLRTSLGVKKVKAFADLPRPILLVSGKKAVVTKITKMQTIDVSLFVTLLAKTPAQLFVPAPTLVLKLPRETSWELKASTVVLPLHKTVQITKNVILSLLPVPTVTSV
jgi:hypothetical protein